MHHIIMPNKLTNDVFERAIFVANKSTMIFKLGCVIIKNGEIISEGYNHYAEELCHLYSIHSEVHALYNLKKMHRNKKFLEDAVMLIVRVGNGKESRTLRSARPCEDCRKAIDKFGIKRVFYSQ